MRAAPTGGREDDAPGQRDVRGGHEGGADTVDPPPWGTWPAFYAAVLLFLAVLIALLAWFTRAFAA